MVPEPRSGHVHVCCCDTTTLDAAALEAASGLLSDDERARAARLVSPVHQRDFTVAHALVRRVLSSWHPVGAERWTFAERPDGKPCLSPGQAEASGLCFNLTHTEGLVACAVTRGFEVGVDLEAIDRRTDPLRLARRFFAPSEAEDLERQPDEARQRRFVDIWTLKEAAVKALGTGLRLPLDDCRFVDDGPDRLRFVQTDGWSDGRWHFALLAPTARHRLAIAVLSPWSAPAEPHVFAWCQSLSAGEAIRPSTGALPEVLRVSVGPSSARGSSSGR